MCSSSVVNKNTLYDLFDSAYVQHPNNTAVIYNCGNHVAVFSYLDLMKEVEKLSECLRCFCESSTYYVGICVKNMHLAPAIVLGILRECKAYLFVKDDASAGQLLQQLGCSWLLLEYGCHCPGLSCELRSQLELHGVRLGLWLVHIVAAQRAPSVKLAYAVQTSGTTSCPSVVQVSHASILPNIIDLQLLLQVTASDIVFLAAPLTFDPSVVEMFLALGSGAALLIVGTEVRRCPQRLLQCLFPDKGRQYAGVTVLQATPSSLRWWLRAGGGVLKELRVLLLGGEPCPPLAELRNWTSSCTNCRIFNVYGVTELSCWASVQEVSWKDHEAGVPLGDPLSCTLLSVRDEAGQTICSGEGEMFIGSLERICFVGDEELKTPTKPIFRATGDIVKVDGGNGNITYVGRTNSIIKRWGHRVDLRLVEQAVHAWRADSQCHCVWDEESNTLGLFLLANSVREVAVLEVRWHLVRSLLPSALPDVIEVLDYWPLTPHGKVNDAALKQSLRESTVANNSRKQKFELEETFVWLWHKYLGPRKPDAEDSFIRSGGNSFIALQWAAELEKLCEQPVPAELVSMLLGGSTFIECCSCLRTLGSSTVSVDEEHGPGGSEGQLPRSSDSGMSDTMQATTSVSGTRVSQQLCSRNMLRQESKDCCEQSAGDSIDRLCLSTCRGRSVFYCKCCEVKARSQHISRAALYVRWKFDLGKCVDASPIAAKYSSGRVLVMAGSHSHKLAALDGITGDLKWQISLPDRIESSVCISACGMRGVVGCYDGSVYCVSLASGVVYWRFRTGQMVKSTASLCRSGSAVVVGSYDHSLYCLSIQDGVEYWRVDLGGSVLASALVEPCSGLVLAASLDGTCTAVSQEDGHCYWRRRLSAPVFTSPALVTAGLALLLEVSGLLHCVATATGDEVWSLCIGGNVFSSPCVVEDGAVLIGCQDGCVYCIYGTGHVRWRTQLDSAVVATACLVPGTNFVVTAASSGNIYLLELCSGMVQCCEPLPHQVFSSPASCQPHHIYIGCRDNHVYCLSVR